MERRRATATLCDATQISREPMKLPTLNALTEDNFKAAMEYRKDDINLNEYKLIGYEAHPRIKAPLSN